MAEQIGEIPKFFKEKQRRNLEEFGKYIEYAKNGSNKPEILKAYIFLLGSIMPESEKEEMKKLPTDELIKWYKERVEEIEKTNNKKEKIEIDNKKEKTLGILNIKKEINLIPINRENNYVAPSIFDEVRSKEREEQRKKLNDNKKELQNVKIGALFSSTIVALLLTGYLGLQKYNNYVNKPINIVTHDILANQGTLITDNGKEKDPLMFEKDDKLELYNYIIKNHLQNDEVLTSIENYCKKNNLNYDYILEQMKINYPSLFEIKINVIS